MGERATREEVLAWMASTGSGAKAAGTRFGISVGTVKSWKRWARKTGWEPPVDPPSTPSDPPLIPPVDPPLIPPADPPSDTPSTAPQGSTASLLSPTSSSSETGRVDPPDPPSTPRQQKRARAQLTAEDLDAEAGRLLRGTAMRLLRYTSGELVEDGLGFSLHPSQEEVLESLGLLRLVNKAQEALAWSPRGAKDALIALGVLVDKCPDILSLGSKTVATEGQGDGPDPGDAADALAGAMGLDEDGE